MWCLRCAGHRTVDHLAAGLADRLGGTVQYSSPQVKMALIASVYGERDLPIDRVTEAPAVRRSPEDRRGGRGDPHARRQRDAVSRLLPVSAADFKENGPPAAGAMRSRPLCHWDLHAAYSPEGARREVCLKVGNAALALAGESGGIALDVLGFIINSAEDLLPRSC